MREPCRRWFARFRVRLRKPGSDMGLRSEDAELATWAQQYDLDGDSGGLEYSFGRPVREVCRTLEKLTGQKFDEEQIFSTFLSGLPSQRRMRQRMYYQTAKRWADWWDANAGLFTNDLAYARANLLPLALEPEQPLAADAHYQIDGGGSNWILQSVLEAKPHTAFYDFDTGRRAGLPRQWREVKDRAAHLDEIAAWATGEGFDLMGTEVEGPDGERIYALRGLGLKIWELPRSRWKLQTKDITLEELEKEGTPRTEMRLPADVQTRNVAPLDTASYFIRTADGTPALLFVGIEVQDDSLQPGGISQGDNELNPVAFQKGRRFAFTFFKEAEVSKNP